MHLIWSCAENTKKDFVITRDTAYKNKTTEKIQFITDATEYKDCIIYKGLKYRYSLSTPANPHESISGEISTIPENDFNIITGSELFTGKPLEAVLEYLPQATNPFDMSELDITMEIIKPNGLRDEAKGFFMTEYKIDKDNNGNEIFIRGSDKIKVRYMPDESGTYIVKFEINDKNKILHSGYYPFDIKQLNTRKYVRVSDKNPLYFETEDGNFFFPAGFNIGWARKGELFEFMHYMDKMAEADINLFRMWMIKWS
ncbi:MAG: hypothetical protein N3B13_10140, partial [Deltaproteobacteria bacterium]|nr:hypothetical protein [Deltaproteobacteria bacterium]